MRLLSGKKDNNASGDVNGQPLPPSDIMSQLFLCDEPYWSKYDHSEICPHALQINVISDGKTTKLTILIPTHNFFIRWPANRPFLATKK